MWKLRTAFSAGGVTSVWLLLAALLAICCVLSPERVLADSGQVSDGYVCRAERHAQLLEKKIAKLQKEYDMEKAGVLSDAEIKDLEHQLEGKKNNLKSRLEAMKAYNEAEVADNADRIESAQTTCLNSWDTGLAKCTEKAKSELEGVLEAQKQDRRLSQAWRKRAARRGAYPDDIERDKHRERQEQKKEELTKLVEDCNEILEVEQKIMRHRAVENKELGLINALWLLEQIKRELK